MDLRQEEFSEIRTYEIQPREYGAGFFNDMLFPRMGEPKTFALTGIALSVLLVYVASKYNRNGRKK
jgi:hypothetical protein